MAGNGVISAFSSDNKAGGNLVLQRNFTFVIKNIKKSNIGFFFIYTFIYDFSKL